MICRAWTERPQEFAFLGANGHVIDTGFAPTHQTVFIKLPLLVSVRAKPAAAIVVPLVLKANRDAILVKSPKLFNEVIVEFLRPFAAQECDDRLASLKELSAVAPAAVFRV